MPSYLPRYTLRYALLAVLLTCAGWIRGANAVRLVDILRHPSEVRQLPFGIAGGTRTIGTGDLRGDQILAIDSEAFHSYRQYQAEVYRHHAGDKIRLTLSRPSGEAFEKEVTIPGYQNTPDNIAVDLSVNILIPVVALFLGAFVVAVRPADGNAWLLFFVMLSFSELVSRDFGMVNWFALAWKGVLGSLWPVFTMLFGIYFPDPPEIERRKPWLKYLFILPCAAIELISITIVFIWYYDISFSQAYRPVLVAITPIETIAGMLAITAYFVNISFKSRSAESADSRRRLRILMWGSSVSISPAVLLALYSVVAGHDIFSGVPWAIVAAAMLFLTLFPLTMAYVIVVERAMDLRFVIRQSLQYGLAKAGLWIVRAVLITLAVVLFTRASWNGRSGKMQPVELTGVGVALLAVRKRTASRASQWVDRKFFREAYDSEKVLSELAKQVGRYTEILPLLERVAATISNTLHVPDIVILLQDANAFVPRFSTRPGEPMNIDYTGNIAKALRTRNEALEIYFDKPPLWIRSLTAEELQTLDFMRTQLLLPLTTGDRMNGMMSLGPKLSKEPYTETDIRLLQAIASQMGLAVENTRLIASLAAEAAQREIANRELEIAREVQERLFPQNYPAVAGLDCAGYCRPARGVGGDYYDFLQLEDGRVGIAVGDVSGKGIAAALLMASLQASLRGQAAAGVHDLSTLMHNVNKLVYEASTSNRYATFFYGEYDTASRRFSFVNAGHNPPVILRGREVLRLEAGGPVVGLLPGARFAQAECVLEPKDVFIAFTDGISEALNDREEEWEEERFIAAAQTCRALPAKEIIRAIFREADAFTGSAKQYDDMTLLVMKLV